MLRSRSSGTCRIREHMQVRERQLLNHAPRLGKLCLGLSRKSHHHVGADGGEGHRRADLQDLFLVMPWPVLAMHPPQNRVASRMQRHMSMLRDPRRARNQLNQLIAPIPRLDRTDSKFLQGCARKNSADEIFQTVSLV